MSLGLIGKKCGMSRIFTEDGNSIPVTVVEAKPNRITQLKSPETDGYYAVQVTVGEKKPSRTSKPVKGHFAKAGVEIGEILREFRISAEDQSSMELGGSTTVAMFAEGQIVDVQGVSRGKGFAGAIKRHNFSMQDATHGNSLSHRAPGSIGQCQTPGRVFKGKKMAGQMGNVTCSVQKQQIVKVDSERHLIFIKGAIPGAPGGTVVVIPSVKGKGESK